MFEEQCWCSSVGRTGTERAAFEGAGAEGASVKEKWRKQVNDEEDRCWKKKK